MFRQLIGLMIFAGVVGALCVQPTFTRAGDEDLQKKLEKMRKDLDDLNAKEKDLAKQRADLQKAISDLQREANRVAEETRIKKEIEQRKFDESDRKKHYVKIELRGKLTHSKSTQPHLQPDMIFVTTNETRWPLVFGDKKELEKQALKWMGKPIIVNGNISTTAKRTLPVEYPRLPDDFWPGISQPFPKPGGNPRMQPAYPYYPHYPFVTDVQLPVAVESIRLVEEK